MAALTNADDEVELLGAALAGTEALLDRTIAQALEEADQDRAREQRVDEPSPAEKQPDEPPSQPSRALLHSLHLCGNQIYGVFVLNRRVDLHAIDAAPARWRGDVGSSPLDRASAAASCDACTLCRRARDGCDGGSSGCFSAGDGSSTRSSLARS